MLQCLACCRRLSNAETIGEKETLQREGRITPAHAIACKLKAMLRYQKGRPPAM